MAANFDIFLMSSYAISPSTVVDIFEPLSDKRVIKEIRVYPDWLFDNKLSQKIGSSEIERYVCIGNIVRIVGTIESASFGILAYSESGMFVYNLWLDTAYDTNLDADEVTDKNRIIYDRITDKLLTPIYDNVLCAALGCELAITCQTDLECMIKSASNVARWILPADIQETCLGSYSYEPVPNHKVIYTKIC